MAWYKTGTVSVTSGSTTVTGAGVDFAANSRVGDAFIGPDGVMREVTNIASETVLSVFPAYSGPTMNSATYLLAPMQGYLKESADRLRAITAGLSGVEHDVAAAKEAAETAVEASGSANTSAILAGQRQLAASASAGAASESATAASGHRDAAQQAADDARSYRDTAETYRTQSGNSATAAAASAAAAKQSEQNTANKAGSGANSDITSLSGLTTPLSVSQGGTGGGTASAARSSLGLKSASIADIVGLVSQVGGVPTGAIIERISNANGDCIKLADGAMIALMNITVTNQSIGDAYGSLFQGSRTWTFPVEFAEAPVVICGCFKWGTSASWPGIANASTPTQGFLRAWDIASRPSGTSTVITAYAIGRWFIP